MTSALASRFASLPGTNRFALGAVQNILSPPAGVLFPFAHIIGDSTPAHVKHLYAVPTVARFRAHLEFLCRHWRPLPLSDVARLPAMRRDRSSLRSFLLSFDDGMRETLETVVPTLMHFGVPAILFVNSATIDNKQLMWRHKVSLLIDRWARQPHRSPPQLAGVKPEQVPSKLRALRYCDRSLIDDLAGFYELDFAQYLRDVQPYLRTDELLTLSRMGFSIGAHTGNHPHLHELNANQQKEEIAQSVAFLRSLGLACEAFAFPFDDRDVSISIFDHLKELNVAVSFGARGAHVDSIPFSFQRFRLDSSEAELSIQRILTQLSMKSLACRLSGSTTIIRR